jgi:radical SAM protein with 4Fe4S-binding SPASM domain
MFDRLKDSGKVKVNYDYFSLSSPIAQARYFISQGNVVSHLIDRIKWHKFPKYFITPGFPTHVDIESSSACQMKCPMCMAHLMKDMKKGVMSFELYKKIVDECAREHVYSIRLDHRGEPLLNPKIVEMVRYAKNRGIKDVAFLTNGERLNPDIIKDLIEARLDWISISFDGMGEVYNRIRYPAIYEETLEKVKLIRKMRDEAGMKKPLIRVQSIYSAIKDDPEKFLNLWDGIADRVNIIADQDRSHTKGKFVHDPDFICPSPWQRMVITYDGKVVQCCSDFLEGNILGDVNQKSLREIWHGSEFENVRTMFRNRQRLKTKPCQVCCDGAYYKEKVIDVGRRKINIIEYIDQEIDVLRIDARKKPE